MAFYKRENDELIITPNSVYAPGYELHAETHSDHTYPIDGWYWFDTLDAALSGLPKAASTTITPLQAKMALLGAGLLDTIETMIASADRATQLAWSEAVSFNRSSAVLNGMAIALGMTTEQLDELFLIASQIEV